VNSSTKVNNLNADSLDGLDSSKLQRRVTASAPIGPQSSAVNADGTVNCASSAVYPIYHSLNVGSSDVSDTFGGSGLSLVGQCRNASLVGLAFRSAGTNASTLNEMYSGDGSIDTIVTKQSTRSRR
jgi:hypothetical protein